MGKLGFLAFVGFLVSLVLISGCELQSSMVQDEDVLSPRFESIKILGASKVSEGSKESNGLAFDLNLQIKRGTGRVFFFSENISNTDTIVSMELGKEIACREFQVACNNNNFFFNIDSKNIRTKGPSAGAAGAMLVSASINDVGVKDSVSMTGTIVSGGVIGPVGGIKEKIDGAESQNIGKVLIPFGYAFDVENDIDLVEYGLSKGVEVVEVRTIFDAYEHVTGERVDLDLSVFEKSVVFDERMRGFSEELCGRASVLVGDVNVNSLNSFQKRSFNDVKGLIGKGEVYSGAGKFYSSATTCFEATINARYLELVSNGLTQNTLSNDLVSLRNDVLVFESGLQSYDTINDFQVFSIVKDRVRDSLDRIVDGEQSLFENNFDVAVQNYAYALERFETAKGWNSLFGLGGSSFDLSGRDLENFCIRSIDSVERKKAYLDSLANYSLPDVVDEQYFDSRSKAIKYLSEGEGELCLFEVSKLDAVTNQIATRVNFVSDVGSLGPVIDDKMRSVERVLVAQQAKGNFPILGYSYLEFAGQLLEDEDVIRSLDFVERAIVFSDLESYSVDSASISVESSRQFGGSGYIVLGFVGAFLVVVVSVVLAISTIRRDRLKGSSGRKRVKSRGKRLRRR